MRILICDDHSVFADALGALLEREGMQVVGVTRRPEQALDFLREHGADLCLLDRTFPDADALDYLPAFQDVAPACRLILLSARLDADTVQRGVAGRVSGFARKQQPLTELITAIQRVAAGELALPDDLLVAALSTRRQAPRTERSLVRHYCRFFTQRERDVLQGIVRGESTVRLAQTLGVSAATARGYVQSVLTKLDVHNRHKAAVLAVREGVVSADTGEWILPEET